MIMSVIIISVIMILINVLYIFSAAAERCII